MSAALVVGGAKSRAAPPAQCLCLPHQLTLAAVPITPSSIWLPREAGLEMRTRRRSGFGTDEDSSKLEGATRLDPAWLPLLLREEAVVLLVRSNIRRSEQCDDLPMQKTRPNRNLKIRTKLYAAENKTLVCTTHCPTLG